MLLKGDVSLSFQRNLRVFRAVFVICSWFIRDLFVICLQFVSWFVRDLFVIYSQFIRNLFAICSQFVCSQFFSWFVRDLSVIYSRIVRNLFANCLQIIYSPLFTNKSNKTRISRSLFAFLKNHECSFVFYFGLFVETL